eukprot:Skav206079  [mRNA]  locus=scaffold74:212380:213678:- [translate_table: standard]
MKYPTDMEAALRLAELDGADPMVGEVRSLLNLSFEAALDSVTLAARAYEELLVKIEQHPDKHLGQLEKVKALKVRLRDVLLWRWFGLTAWIYNQAEADFFQTYGRMEESQLMNGVTKIRQRLMQDLMRRPCWNTLQKMLVQCAATDIWTPEFQGFVDRFQHMIGELGGLRDPFLQAVRMSKEEEEEVLQLDVQEAEARAAEADFEKQVWDCAGRKVSESVVGLLGIDDPDDFDLQDDPWTHGAFPMMRGFDQMGTFDQMVAFGDPSFAAGTAMGSCDQMGANDEVDGDPASAAATAQMVAFGHPSFAADTAQMVAFGDPSFAAATVMGTCDQMSAIDEVDGDPAFAAATAQMVAFGDPSFAADTAQMVAFGDPSFAAATAMGTCDQMGAIEEADSDPAFAAAAHSFPSTHGDPYDPSGHQLPPAFSRMWSPS